MSVMVKMECGGNIVKCQLGLRWSVGGQSKVSVRVRMECGKHSKVSVRVKMECGGTKQSVS